MKKYTKQLTKAQRKARSERKTWTHAVKKVKQAKTRGTDTLMKRMAKALKKINDQAAKEQVHSHVHSEACSHDHAAEQPQSIEVNNAESKIRCLEHTQPKS